MIASPRPNSGPPLPPPSPEALAASEALTALIRSEIAAAGGWLGFARYMELALYAPALGYYAGGSAKLGAPGDFVTAPELGDLYGRTLARQVADLLPAGGDLLEFGAGSGALAQTMTRELAALGRAPGNYLIIEPSAELAARQRLRLEALGLGTRFQWRSTLPDAFRGVMLANEVVDAMPAHAVAWTPDGLVERGVTLDASGLRWTDRPATGAVAEAMRTIAVDLPPSGRYESEINLAGPAWLRAIAASLAEGALLVIDYGFTREEYYHPQRSTGTLMCHYRHHAHGDPFFLPGLQDITTHVDFSALAAAGANAGLDLLGYAGQAQFLINCGITELLARTDPTDVRRYAPLAGEAQKLLSPAEMGELFKVMALGRGTQEPLAGFAAGDRRARL